MNEELRDSMVQWPELPLTICENEPISGQFFHFKPPKNTRKPLFFWSFLRDKIRILA